MPSEIEQLREDDHASKRVSSQATSLAEIIQAIRVKIEEALKRVQSGPTAPLSFLG